MYQILFDLLARNQKFWKHYGEDLRIKYIFFIQTGKITRISFTTFLRIAKLYADRVDDKTPLEEPRRIADGLLSTYLKRAPAHKLA